MKFFYLLRTQYSFISFRYISLFHRRFSLFFSISYVEVESSQTIEKREREMSRESCRGWVGGWLDGWNRFQISALSNPLRESMNEGQAKISFRHANLSLENVRKGFQGLHGSIDSPSRWWTHYPKLILIILLVGLLCACQGNSIILSCLALHKNTGIRSWWIIVRFLATIVLSFFFFWIIFMNELIRVKMGENSMFVTFYRCLLLNKIVITNCYKSFGEDD